MISERRFCFEFRIRADELTMISGTKAEHVEVVALDSTKEVDN